MAKKKDQLEVGKVYSLVVRNNGKKEEAWVNGKKVKNWEKLIRNTNER